MKKFLLTAAFTGIVFFLKAQNTFLGQPNHTYTLSPEWNSVADVL